MDCAAGRICRRRYCKRPTVWLHTANARVTQWQRTQQGQRTDFTLQGHVPPQFSVAGMAPPAS